VAAYVVNFSMMIGGQRGSVATRMSQLLPEQVVGLVDIGASGGLEPRWSSIQKNLRAFLFEPDERSHQALRRSDHIAEVFPVGLGSSEKSASLNLCRKPTVSSFLHPLNSFLSRFPDVKRFDVISQETMKLSTLDICLKDRNQDCDFIKIDTQGTELAILKGGDIFLDGPIIGLEVEVEFVRIYEGQNLFGDVCLKLESKGYEFFDFVNICRWERERLSLFGQAVFGDGLFLRSPENFSEILPSLPADVAQSKAIKYMVIVSMYDHLDLLPICKRLFEPYISDTDQQAVDNLYGYLLRHRRISSFLFEVVGRFLRPFGLRAMGLQVS
jgi:FkbM family methyltransferase